MRGIPIFIQDTRTGNTHDDFTFEGEALYTLLSKPGVTAFRPSDAPHIRIEVDRRKHRELPPESVEAA